MVCMEFVVFNSDNIGDKMKKILTIMIILVGITCFGDTNSVPYDPELALFLKAQAKKMKTEQSEMAKIRQKEVELAKERDRLIKEEADLLVAQYKKNEEIRKKKSELALEAFLVKQRKIKEEIGELQGPRAFGKNKSSCPWKNRGRYIRRLSDGE